MADLFLDHDDRSPTGMVEGRGYDATRARVTGYFDATARRAWEDLTSDAPVSRIRATVRAGRERMRALMLGRLPGDLRGARILDAGCGTGAMSAALAGRGAQVLAVDVAPSLLIVAARRLPEALVPRVSFVAGDMFDARLGAFDAVVAQDSMIYYGRDDLAARLAGLAARSPRTVFTVAPRTPMLAAMWWAGRAFPKADRSPRMVPHSVPALCDATGARDVGRVASGFYISQCLEIAP